METQVTIKLGGKEYRTLCRELEYHDLTLREQLKDMAAGHDKRALMQRVAEFQFVVEKVKA